MSTGLAIIGLALFVVWLAIGALVGFTAWFIGATFLILALLFALRVDALTRQVLRRRRESRDGDLKEPPDA